MPATVDDVKAAMRDFAPTELAGLAVPQPSH